MDRINIPAGDTPTRRLEEKIDRIGLMRHRFRRALHHGQAGYAPLKKGQTVAIGSTIRTGDDGVAVLVTTPGSAIQVGNSSILKINQLAFAKSGAAVTQRTAVLQLTSGVVSALIDPSTPKITNFQVQTPEGAAAARGTFYAVLVYHGKTYIGVKEGHVGVQATGQ